MGTIIKSDPKVNKKIGKKQQVSPYSSASSFTERGFCQMYPYFEQIQADIEARREPILEMFRTLVNLEGHYKEKAQVEKARDYVQSLLEAEGFRCRIREVAPDRAGALIGILGEDRPGKPILFSGHIDTVHYTGSFDGPNPFRVEDGKVYGPGVLDMKGGIAIAIRSELGLPVRYIGVGEQIDDLQPFDAREFIEAIL